MSDKLHTNKNKTITKVNQNKVILAVIESLSKYNLDSGDLQTIVLACKTYQDELDKLNIKNRRKKHEIK